MNYVFIERFNTVCYNLYSSTKNNNAAEALAEAKQFTRGGNEVIQIEGNFIYSMNKIVGIEINCGGQLFKNEEGCYDHNEVLALIESRKG